MKKAACITALLILTGGFLTSCTENPSGMMEEPKKQSPTPFENFQSPEPSKTSKPQEPRYVEFTQKTITVNGRDNEVYILLADITKEGVRVEPYLSFDKIYGFQTLSDMVFDTGARNAVNGGFFFEFGRPSGLVAIDGETISPGTGRFESIIWNRTGARFETVRTDVKIKIQDLVLKADKYNEPSEEPEIAVFSPAYGNTDRGTHERRIVVIENGIVKNTYATNEAAEIPDSGYIVSIPMDAKGWDSFKGERAVLNFNPEFEEGTMAYECASMLVREGESLAGDIMPWIGNLNHYDPRTCIGITADGLLGFVVIDGRQPGYSSGTTGRETADIMIRLGFTDAAMLDGGASSEIIIDGEIANRPSAMGRERTIAGAFMIYETGN